MSTNTFPHPLARIAGLSIDQLNNCIEDSLIVKLNFTLNTISTLEIKKEELNKQLYIQNAIFDPFVQFLAKKEQILL